ncbi:MAG: hypothetical protein R8G60_15465 [Roseovarius pacificus]|nr:hypothetical protein [Roseovarius pacificus]
MQDAVEIGKIAVPDEGLEIGDLVLGEIEGAEKEHHRDQGKGAVQDLVAIEHACAHVAEETLNRALGANDDGKVEKMPDVEDQQEGGREGQAHRQKACHRLGEQGLSHHEADRADGENVQADDEIQQAVAAETPGCPGLIVVKARCTHGPGLPASRGRSFAGNISGVLGVGRTQFWRLRGVWRGISGAIIFTKRIA